MGDCRILVVDDEEVILDSVRDYFDEYSIVTHSDPRKALEDMRSIRSDVLVCDYRMPHLSGLELLREGKKLGAYRYGVLLTAFADKELLLRAIQEELVNRVVEKPLRMEVLEGTLRDAIIECRRDESRRLELAEARAAYRTSIGSSSVLCDEIVGLEGGLGRVYETIKRASGSRESILVTGETGTGKEVAARLIHSLSGYRAGPFVKINCGAIPETLLESELFGHVRGAFSGAESDKAGKIELAAGGTLFLDEIGELKETAQTRFLQVLQDKTVERIGSNRRCAVDFRLICATNRDLGAEVEAGRFRRDLYYRINAIPIRMPALRERAGDIPALAHSIVGSYCAEIGRPPLGLTSKALSFLTAYPWPGNIRELENAIRRAIVLTDPHETAVSTRPLEHLQEPPSDARSATAPGTKEGLDDVVGRLGSLVLAEGISLAEIESRLLADLLSRNGGSVPETTRRTGIPRDRFYRYLGKLREGRPE